MRSGPGSGRRSAPSPDPDPPGRQEPWVETRAGGLFFVNVLLVTPVAVVLFPLLLGALLRSAGALEGPSRMLDTIPMVAAYVAPWLGWLAAPAAALAWWTRGRVERSGPRAWLVAFLVLHVATVAYTVWRWTGGGGV